MAKRSPTDDATAAQEAPATDAQAPEAAAPEAAAPEPVAAKPEAPAEPTVSLDEYCARKSAGHRQPFALTPFHAEEAEAGRLNDTYAAFDARFQAMLNRPAR